MSLLKFISFTRPTCAASLRRIQKAPLTAIQTPNNFLGSIQYGQYSQITGIHQDDMTNKWYGLELNPADNIFSKMKYFIKFHLISKSVYRGKAALLYRHTVDSLDHIKFMKDFRMADTYYSWFLINELHVWMLMVRLTAGGRPGMEARKFLVNALWEDADVRRKKLGTVTSSVVAKQMQMIGNQFNAAIIGYDEGLMGNDKILAGAIWRRMFQLECNDPELVEKLVAYVRKNIQMLDSVPVGVLIGRSRADFTHYNQC